MNRRETYQLEFERWASEHEAEHELSLDQLFMSTNGVPENPYLSKATRLCYDAFLFAMAISTNYVADKECAPTSVEFFNGRRVFIRDGSLDVETVR